MSIVTGTKRKRLEDPSIIWTEEMESFLLIFYHQQLQEKSGEKTLKGGSWNTIANCMFGINFTMNKCRNKISILRRDYAAYKSIIDASGLGVDSDNAIWDELISRNPRVAVFRDGTRFPHYDKMSEIVGDKIFDGNEMIPQAQQVLNDCDDDMDDYNDDDNDDLEVLKGTTALADFSSPRGTSSSDSAANRSNNINRPKRSRSRASNDDNDHNDNSIGEGLAALSTALVTVVPPYHAFTEAMKCFEKPPLNNYLMNVDTRYTIFDYLKIKDNAKMFLGIPQDLKEDFIKHYVTH